MVVLIAAGLFWSALGARDAELKAEFAGLLPARISVDAAGNAILSPWREGTQPFGAQQTGQLFQLGVLEGDILVAVDGVEVKLPPGHPVPEGWLLSPDR